MGKVGLDGGVLESGDEGCEFGGAELVVGGEGGGAGGSADWGHVVPFYALVETEGHIVPTKRINERDMMEEVAKTSFGNDHVSQSLPMNLRSGSIAIPKLAI